MASFLTGTTSSFLYDPAPTFMYWRSLYGAFYAEDVFRVNRKLTVSLGFRDEFSTGWNEAHDHAANYTFTDGVISSTPNIGSALFTKNRAKFLPQPRIGIAWSPVDSKTVIRAGFGMYNDLQDALGYRADQNAPYNATYTIPGFTVSKFPIDPTRRCRRGETSSRRSAARHVYTDADFLVAASGKGIVAEYGGDRRDTWVRMGTTN